MNIMRRTTDVYFWAALLASLWLGGCSTDDIPLDQEVGTVSVPLSIMEEGSNLTRALGDATPSVNRVLILPFKKTNESLANDPANFVPDYTAVKQIDLNAFPLNTAMLRMTAGSTYQLMVIGYNRNDYDFANPAASGRRFDLGISGRPSTLADVNLKLINATDVPELFSCMGNGYNGTVSVGGLFKPEQVNNIKGTLNRISSGLTLNITNIPAYVSSIRLRAEQLVTAVKAADGTPVQWQVVGDTGVRTLELLAPASGKVTFNMFMLPTLDARKTLLYLDVIYAGITEQYTVKIADVANVVSGNRIIFSPNHWVRIDGDYNKINLGFTLSNNINLDDNAWDGIQNY